eukprot:gene10410-11499_t
MHIIRTAAKLIKNGIKLVETSNEYYPPTDEIENPQKCLSFLPESLKAFLGEIVTGKDVELKLASIGQAIMQISRPRVQRYEKNAVNTVNTGTNLENFTSETVQYVADNVDHNIRTLDGNDTFHGMSIIANITPATKQTTVVPRKTINPQDVSDAGKIDIQYQKMEGKILANLRYDNSCLANACDSTENLEIFWKTSLLFGPVRPCGSSMMQLAHQGSALASHLLSFYP